jgi:hypothetical protein
MGRTARRRGGSHPDGSGTTLRYPTRRGRS